MDAKLEINPDAKEPNEYFKLVKGSLQDIDADALQASLSIIAEHILHAQKIGQTSFLRRLAFTGDVILKEQVLFANGIKSFVSGEDVKRYLDTIKPVNSVKVIELERYPRAIPLDCMIEIEKVQALGIFTDYFVLFTDFTDTVYKTPQEKALVERNRDPIVFGYFQDAETGHKHDRYYFITDWVDQYCDLTFPNLIARMECEGIRRPKQFIGQGSDYIQTLVQRTLRDTMAPSKKKSFWKKWWPWRK